MSDKKVTIKDKIHQVRLNSAMKQLKVIDKKIAIWAKKGRDLEFRKAQIENVIKHLS